MANELEKIQTPAGTYNIQDAGARTLISGLDDAKFNKSNIDTSIANPSSDTKVLSEKAVVDNYFNKSNIDTSMANPTSDAKVLSEKAVVNELEAKANKDGSYPTMSVGEAESLKTSLGALDKTPFNYNTVGINSDVETGYQELKKLVGCKVVKNQCYNDNISIANGVTRPSPYKIKVSTAYENNVWNGAVVSSPFVSGHYYFVYIGTILTGTDSFVVGNHNVKQTSIIQITSNLTNLGLTHKGIYDEFYFYVIDLTQRYGSNDVVNAIIGNDSATQANKLIAFDTNILKDTAYDAGSFSSCKSAKLKTIDYNQWDEETRNGYYTDTGAFVSNANRLANKNPIRVIPNSTYYFNKYTDGFAILQYDENMNYLGVWGTTLNGVVTTSNNCYYINFCTLADSTYGDTYNNDISIFLYWDGSRIGYEPYAEHIVDLPNVDLNGILKVDGDGNVYADGDELTPDGSGNSKKYDIVDLGSLDWTKRGGSDAYPTTPCFQSRDLINLVKYPATNVIIANIICARYNAASWNFLANSSQEMLISIAADGYLNIRDNTYSTAADFKAAMNGVYLVYELATPTTLTADTFSFNFYGDDFGTMQFLDENDNIIDGLQGNEIFYKANIAGFAESVYAKVNGEPNDLVVQSDLSGLVSQVDLSDKITDNASLTYSIKKLVKTGNIVTLCIRATVSADASSLTTLFTISNSITPTAFRCIGNTNTAIKIFNVETDGTVRNVDTLSNGDEIYLNVSYTVA